MRTWRIDAFTDRGTVVIPNPIVQASTIEAAVAKGARLAKPHAKSHLRSLSVKATAIAAPKFDMETAKAVAGRIPFREMAEEAAAHLKRRA
jgi:hypothetical protein